MSKYWIGNEPNSTVTSAQAQIIQGLGDVSASAAEINKICDDSVNYVNVTDAATYSILAANSGKLHIMPDLTADCTLSFPTAAAGLRYKFISKAVAADAQDWIFDTGSDTNFYLGGITELDTSGNTVVLEVPDGNSNSKMSILTPDPGSFIEFICDGTNWIVNGIVQSDTSDAITWADQS